jgi:thiamine pyrophosphokinase
MTELLVNIFGSIALATSCIGVMPQIYKSYLTKSSIDVSMLMLLNFLLCSVSWIIYGHLTDSGFVVYSNYLCALTSIISIVQKMHYDRIDAPIIDDDMAHTRKSAIKLLADLSMVCGEYKSIICLNGKMPEASFFHQFKKLPVIAIDGASGYLNQIRVKPAMIIGDLDSHQSAHFPDVKKIFLPDQDLCDFVKTIEHINKESLLPAIITGINGGFLDQILKNFSIFAVNNCIFYDDSQLAFMMDARKSGFKDHITITVPVASKISIMACPEAVISSTGLQWELNEYVMNFFGNNSYSNRSTQEKLYLKLHSGSAIVIIYL